MKDLIKNWSIFFQTVLSTRIIIPLLMIGLVVVAKESIKDYIPQDNFAFMTTLEVGALGLSSFLGADAISYYRKNTEKESTVEYQKGLTSLRTLSTIHGKIVRSKDFIDECTSEIQEKSIIKNFNSIERNLTDLQMDIANAMSDWEDLFPKINEAVAATQYLIDQERASQNEIPDEKSHKLSKISNSEVPIYIVGTEKKFHFEEPYRQFVASGTGSTGAYITLDEVMDQATGPTGPSSSEQD